MRYYRPIVRFQGGEQGMIRKIVSNGRIGVAIGALEAAVALDIPRGGWTLSGDDAVDRPLIENYHLQELSTRSLAKCVERNVRDSDGTLIITFSDDLPDDAMCARKSADKHHIPCLRINLARSGKFEAAQSIHEWLKDREIRIIHVVGATHQGRGKKAGKTTADLLEAVYYLGLIENNMTSVSDISSSHPEAPPTSVDDIVSRISTDMTLKDRVIMANLKESQLPLLEQTLGRYILTQLEHWQKMFGGAFSPVGLEAGIKGNEEVCRRVIGKLWEKLRRTHRLRMVK